MRVPAAATIINLVVITAATSSCNSGIFSTGRMLFSLAQRGQAPRALAHLSAQRVPATGINVSAAVMLVAVALNYAVPETAFVYVTSISTIGTLWTWGIIMVAHRNYRRAVAAGSARAAPFRMPGAPYANWLVIVFLLAVTAMLGLDDDTRVALYVAPVWFGLLGLGYLWSKPQPAQHGA
jgi:AAT family amino acid transporter